MRDEDGLKTPDAYIRNHGVEVERNKVSPEYGQVYVRVKHNPYQSSMLQMGKEQAVELHEKLGTLLAELDKPVAPAVGTVVKIVRTAHDDLRGKTGTVEHIMGSGNLQVAVGSECIILAPEWVEVV